MEIKYKPSKPQKVKPAKPAKPAKAATPAKAAPIGVGSATAVKIEKPKKVKTPKAPKAPKPEKVQAVSFGKAQKVEKSEGSLLKKSVEPKTIVAIVLAVVAVAAIAVTLIFVLPKDEKTDINAYFDNMEVLSLPTKQQYYVGEDASYYGLQLKITMKSGGSYVVGPEDCEISGFDSSAPAASQTIKIKYKNFSTSYTVKIVEKSGSDMPSGGKINGLSFKTLPKTQYKVGEPLSTDGGLLICHYDDGTTEEIELDHKQISGFSSKTPGTYTLTVVHADRGVLMKTTYTITVTK